ncbi:lipoprotein [Wohlfahrtiimonas larvae]|uniref:Type IV secretion system putative lipoprotein virB7 n=1 Tax=Wohlfahrtiimonas larvae TaxID=1157986 RepID=A0ABP9MPV1_9GAMM|nr:lipoprotein [Wohlfahrtiimonas larvae]
MKKIFLTLSLIATLAACTTTTQTTNHDATNSTASSTQFSDQWVSQLKTHKTALRSCIVSNKDIQAILYMDPQPNATVFTVSTKSGTVLDCSVNPTTNNVINIAPRTANLPININKFYPVGKRLPDVCKGKVSMRDEEDRLMGIVCY